jgi:hypothetical protein
VEEIMTKNIDEIYALATGPRDKLALVKSKRAQRDMIDFLCDDADIEHTVSNSADYLLNALKEQTTPRTVFTGSIETDRLNLAPRECIIKLIEHNIGKGDSSYEENKAIVGELLMGGWSLTDISNVFRFIYNEPAGHHGWYDDNPEVPGKQIVKFSSSLVWRYKTETLIARNLCRCEAGTHD